MSLKSSTMAVEGALKISKTLKVPVLLEVEEMENLLEALPGAHFYLIQGICSNEEGIVTPAEFIEVYAAYIDALKNGKEGVAYKRHFSSAMSVTHEALYSIEVDPSRHIIKAKSPVIQLQPNLITYAEEEKTFRSQQFGSGGIEWGVQFSYPQLFQDPFTQEVLDVDEEFPNTTPFKTLQRWMRGNTLPTPFVVRGVRMNSPIRLGKKCFSWIGVHRGLQERGISIHGAI